MSDEEIEFVVNPYQYEPEESQSEDNGESTDSSSVSSDDETPANPSAPDAWCTCDNCGAMSTLTECLCCRDVARINEKMSDGMQCITEHEGFQGNCLNPHVIEVSFYEFLDDHGPVGDEEPIHELYRYIAYRRFTRWIWHTLGRKNRRVIPSCAVSAIRNSFPSENYTGFQYPRHY